MVFDWKEAAEHSFNMYFNTIRKRDDIHEAQQAYEMEMSDRFDEAGLEFEEWTFDAPIDDLSTYYIHLIEHVKNTESELEYAVNITAPFHTFIADRIYDWANWVKSQEDISDEQKLKA